MKKISFLIITLLLCVMASPAWALKGNELDGNVLVNGIISTFVYGVVGIILLLVGYKVVDMLIPGHISRQIAEEKNLATAVVAGCMLLGISIIIAAVIAS